MKKRLVLVAFAMIHLLLLASCAAPQPTDTPDSPPVSESEVPPSASPESPSSPSVSLALSKPPVIPEEERVYPSMPCLVKLEPYIGGSYTDGVNTYIFQDDGTVLWNNSDGGVSGRVVTFEKKDIEKPLDKKALMETEDYKAVCEKAAGHLGDDYPGQLFIAHRDGDTWYLYYDYPTGGGSGESYWITDRTVFVKIGANGEFADLGDLKAAHIIWYDEHFYYVELVSDISGTPGIGKVMRVDMDGANRETIVDEPVFGTIQLTGGRLYYTSLDDGRAYSVDLDGRDKTPVSDKIVPVYHRVGLEFCGDVIISRYWNNPGYVYSYFTVPSDYTAPAIMDINERNLITFPPELSGDNGYEVINWGGEDSYYDEHGYGRQGDYFVFLKSERDGSYWVYKKFGFNDPSPFAFNGAREEWAAKAD
jgi:hypothetical protein